MSFGVQGPAELQSGFLEEAIVNLARFSFREGPLQPSDFFQFAAAFSARPHMVVERRAVLLRQLVVQEEVYHFFVLPVVHRFTPIRKFFVRTTLLLLERIIGLSEPFAKSSRREEEISFHRPFGALHQLCDLPELVSFIVPHGEDQSLFW